LKGRKWQHFLRKVAVFDRQKDNFNLNKKEKRKME